MSQDCDICDSASKDTTYLELGPAYQDYKNGISVSRNWRQDAGILDLFGLSCCADYKFEPLVFVPVLSTHLLWFFSLVYVSLVVLIILNRNHQPVKFRRADHLILHLSLVYLQTLLTILNKSADYTGSCAILDFSLWVLYPVMLSYYVLKTYQLAFIYSWSFAKLRADRVAAQWFFNRKKFLSSNLLYFWLLFVAVIGSLGMGLSQLSSNFNDGNSLITTGRCYWWEVPAQHTVAYYPSSACACYDAFVLSDYTQQTACQSALLTTCLNGTLTIPPLSLAETTELCVACIANPTSGDCQFEFFDWLSTGACGWPSHVPDYSQCFGCSLANRSVFAAWVTFKLITLTLILVGLLLILRMDDNLLIRVEVLLVYAATMPLDICFILLQTSISASEDIAQFTPFYGSYTTMNYISTGMMMLVSYAMPVLASYLWRHPINNPFKYTRVESEQQLQNDDGKRSSKDGESSVLEMVMRRRSQRFSSRRESAVSSSNAASTHSPETLGVRDSISGQLLNLDQSSQFDELELAFTLENHFAFELYTDFSCKEFTVENILFLRAVKSLLISSQLGVDAKPNKVIVEPKIQLHRSPSAEDSSKTMNRFEIPVASSPINHITWIISEFLAENSSMQINIASRLRKKILDDLDKALISSGVFGDSISVVEASSRSLANLGPAKTCIRTIDTPIGDPSTLTPAQIDECIKALMPAVHEVKRLILRDSWPRFCHTKEYAKQFLRFFSEQENADEILKSNLASTM